MSKRATCSSIKATAKAFKQTLASLPPQRLWIAARENYRGFYRAADEALSLPNGVKLLPTSQRLSFDERMSVRYLVGGRGHGDSAFHGLLFVGGQFEALVWIQRDPDGYALAWRGNWEAMQTAETLLMLFEGETLAHLR